MRTFSHNVCLFVICYMKLHESDTEETFNNHLFRNSNKNVSYVAVSRMNVYMKVTITRVICTWEAILKHNTHKSITSNFSIDHKHYSTIYLQ